jgi:hypothetical protein
MLPIIQVPNLARDEIVWTDSTTTVWVTYVWKIAAGETPVSTRTWVDAWKLYLVNANGEMLKPVDPVTGLYFDPRFENWDDRAAYTYW